MSGDLDNDILANIGREESVNLTEIAESDKDLEGVFGPGVDNDDTNEPQVEVEV